MLEADQRQGRYREVMHCAVKAYRLLIVDEIVSAQKTEFAEAEIFEFLASHQF